MEKPKKGKDGNKNKFYTHFRLKDDVAMEFTRTKAQ